MEVREEEKWVEMRRLLFCAVCWGREERTEPPSVASV